MIYYWWDAGSKKKSMNTAVKGKVIESIAEDCGFNNEEQMRCAFVRISRIPPREYRKRFASSAIRE